MKTRLNSQLMRRSQQVPNGGMAPRRSARLGVTRRRSTCLCSQTNLTEEDAGMAPRSTSLAVDVDDDTLREILVRLPRRPSSLLRASAVCKRWRGLISDAKFQRHFCTHHRNPPLLGAFAIDFTGDVVFSPFLDPPDRIPPLRFNLIGRECRFQYNLLSCRHGRVLLKESLPLVTPRRKEEVMVYDPITGEQRCLTYPTDFNTVPISGAVLCAAAAVDHGHVHGNCHSSPFKVVVLSVYRINSRLIACVYSSQTGLWGNIISTESLSDVVADKPAVFVGKCIYWLTLNAGILEFDSDDNSLAVMRGPPLTDGISHVNSQIVRTEDGAVCYATLSYPFFQMWKRNITGNGGATWVVWKTIKIDTIPGIPYWGIGWEDGIIQGYDEVTSAIYLGMNGSVYMVTLESMQSSKLCATWYLFGPCHPFRSFYMPAIRECDEADMVHGP